MYFSNDRLTGLLDKQYIINFPKCLETRIIQILIRLLDSLMEV